MTMRMHGTMIALAVTATLLLAAHEADAGARRSRPVKTGQQTCSDVAGNPIDCADTGHDGDLRRGEPRSQVDQGNGTIRDQRAALTWEKLSDDGSIHDKDFTYSWPEAFEKIDELNTEPCFAGFCDWRLPNRFELETLVNLENSNPAVSAAFNTNCGADSSGNPGCTVTTCSCTGFGTSVTYWSSTTYRDPRTSAWAVSLNSGSIAPNSKDLLNRVRAVRGGAN